ncbi:hypothetical protein NQ318_023490 [Aromia moschata]|uniref:PiggyBac transposable element-derived protein domain-containing protein n=1 Tax=Aromia moschata TaxID=1265417 RepID=A0AAV8YPW3_9CUCU|nr:hypothetical protein NQ318_023490 [Aromia moschata]
MDSHEEASSSESDYEEILQESGSDTSVESFSNSSSNSGVSADLSLVRNWCELQPDAPAPPAFPFTAVPAVNLDTTDEWSILQYFEAFLDDGLITHIVNETNSVVKKPELRQYWSKNPLLVTPFFSQCLSNKIFEAIHQNLHFSNNDEFDEASHPNPKLNKIWPVYDCLVTKFREAITPEKYIAIDESLLLYKGRLGWIQYIPLKRARFGIKTYMLCESKSGYVWNFIIYTGKQTNLDADYKDLPVSSQVVMTLLKPLLNLGYTLTMDNFYNSPQLADLLLTHKTDVYGTLKLSRKEVPNELKSKKLKKGETASYQRGKVTILKWKDKKEIALISTVHSNTCVEIEKRGETKVKPKVVVDYNDTMGGVHRVDQHLADYSLPRKRGKKYYKKLFFHLLDLALWNSFIVYRKCGGNKSALVYRMDLIQQIMEKYHQTEFSCRRGRPSANLTPLRLTGRHFPEYIPATEKKKNPTRQCGICSRVRDARGKKNPQRNSLLLPRL